jgi:cellulose synthase/poly-beta-1,6-N-acetylglucosamine synthase-like glycosyltransferase
VPERDDKPGPEPTVSVLVPVLDERPVLPAVLERIRAQRIDGAVEILLVDGGSTDGSVELLEAAAQADPRVRVLRNPAGRISPALNIALRHARGRYVARMDAHTLYPPGYLAAGVRRLAGGDVDWVSGPPIPRGRGPWSRRAALALRSPMGGGGGIFRRPTSEVEVTSGFTGMWRRDTLEALGGWDEGWDVNEDVEMGARIRRRGGRVVCIPEMAAEWMPRDSLAGLARQYFRWGVFRAKSARRHPDSMRRPHALPLGLLGAVVTAGSRLGPVASAARALLVVYAAAVALVGARAAQRERSADGLLVPPVLVVMHLAWACGFVVGCARFGVPWTALRRLGPHPPSRAPRRP